MNKAFSLLPPRWSPSPVFDCVGIDTMRWDGMGLVLGVGFTRQRRAFRPTEGFYGVREGYRAHSQNSVPCCSTNLSIFSTSAGLLTHEVCHCCSWPIRSAELLTACRMWYIMIYNKWRHSATASSRPHARVDVRMQKQTRTWTRAHKQHKRKPANAFPIAFSAHGKPRGKAVLPVLAPVHAQPPRTRTHK